MFSDAGLPAPWVVYPVGFREEFTDALADVPVAGLVEGGATRAASVRAGLNAARQAGAPAIVAVHDAARPLAPAAQLVAAVIAVQSGALAAAPGLPIADTLKRVTDGQVVATVDRDGLVGIQTPQVFRWDIAEAVAASARDATDELTVVEMLRADGQISGDIAVVDGSPLAHKLTTPADLQLLEQLADPGGPR